jgi:DNA-binding response OmpR family regulator
MNTPRPERLDQILIRLGFVSAEQVAAALRKQQGLGGRLGSHLVYDGCLTEAKLAQALALQFDVPAFDPERHQPSRELMQRLPTGMARRHLVLPIAFDASSGVLSLAAVDPRDTTALAEVRRWLSCSRLDLCVIAEVTFLRVLDACAPGADALQGPLRMIELPELFEGAKAEPAAPDVPGGASADADAPGVLLVSPRGFLPSFLTPVFEREGRPLSAAADAEETAACLKRGGIGHVLVAAETAEAWRDWVRDGRVPAPRVPVTRLESVSATLLGAVAPYAAMYGSLLRALRLHAGVRHDAHAIPLAHDLLCRDARALGEAVGLERLAVDGLEAAVLLLVPAPPPAADVAALLADDGTGIDWKRTLADAAAIGFPWPLEGALSAMRQLLGERVNLDEFGRQDPALATAAEVLAVVWHHHQRGGRAATDGQGGGLVARADLRARTGRLARAEIIERYLAMIERSEGELLATANQQLMVVGDDPRALRPFTSRLSHLGYRVMEVATLEEAAALCGRLSPAAVFVLDDGASREVMQARERLTATAPVSVYALSANSEPSRMLTLFDAGFDDVFTLPRDVDLAAARLRKALRAAAAGDPAASAPARPGSFQASFTAFAFTDLMQTLSQSLKSVRIDLARPNGEQAVVYLDRGQLTHAACGELTGGWAVYRIIAWEDDGRFAVEPTTAFPEPNIGLPLESVLMEGCRLLDESRLKA